MLTTIILGILLVFSISFGAVSRIYPQKALAQGGGAAFVPLFIAGLMSAMIILYFILHRHEIRESFTVRKKISFLPLFWVAFCLVLFASPFILRLFGFRIAAMIIIFTLIVILRRNFSLPGKVEIISVIIAAFLFPLGLGWFFEGVLRILLPKGILF
jgi:hypothetical protein